MRRHPLATFVTTLAIATAGCAGIHPVASSGAAGKGGHAGATGSGGSSGFGGTGAATDGGATAGTGTPPAGRCGDGHLAAGEACDDGNTRAGDGCSADCRTVETDYDCPTPGKLCTYLVKCGDGRLGGIEQCDPPNVGHGCTADCRLEPAYVCSPPPVPANPSKPSTCHKPICGDGNREGLEACDDHNTTDGDGCASTCTLEPDCTGGACASRCGDGVKLSPEECDDGNSVDGDGCSATCTLEVGFSCTDVTMMPAAALNLAVTYRDFVSFPIGSGVRHPDFESPTFQGMDVTPNLVKAMLDATGKPVIDGRCTTAGVTAQCPYDQQLTGAASFGQWYQDVAGVNLRIAGTLPLTRQPNGSYVYDSGTSGFYPIDDRGWIVSTPARETTATADAMINDGLDHNFGFTTEIHYFFQYRGGETLVFSGDDDVWIFFNHRLALDLGGLHTRVQRTLNVDQSAASLALTKGGLYDIALFHAERHSTGSNFKLTLTGFAPTTSSCRSACGDGVKAANEQCDDGNNMDGDGCSHDCHVEIVID